MRMERVLWSVEREKRFVAKLVCVMFLFRNVSIRTLYRSILHPLTMRMMNIQSLMAQILSEIYVTYQISNIVNHYSTKHASTTKFDGRDIL